MHPTWKNGRGERNTFVIREMFCIVMKRHLIQASMIKYGNNPSWYVTALTGEDSWKKIRVDANFLLSERHAVDNKSTLRMEGTYIEMLVERTGAVMENRSLEQAS
jgi:hypothetical protein